MPRSWNTARPSDPVRTSAVPITDPPPEAISTVTPTPRRGTTSPLRSSNSTTGEEEKTSPLRAVSGGGALSLKRTGVPPPGPVPPSPGHPMVAPRHRTSAAARTPEASLTRSERAGPAGWYRGSNGWFMSRTAGAQVPCPQGGPERIPVLRSRNIEIRGMREAPARVSWACRSAMSLLTVRMPMSSSRYAVGANPSQSQCTRRTRSGSGTSEWVGRVTSPRASARAPAMRLTSPDTRAASEGRSARAIG